MTGNFTEIEHVRKRKFLNAFALAGGVRRAADRSGVSFMSHYNWLKEDAQYAEAFKQAQVIAGDTLEDEAVRRAQDGVDKPVFYKGRQVATMKEYSDSLMVVLLKGNKPDKYRDRTDITTAGKELRIALASADSI